MYKNPDKADHPSGSQEKTLFVTLGKGLTLMGF